VLDDFCVCRDECPSDPDKTNPGICGCGVPDTDTDHDDTPDCNDRCPDDPSKLDPGACGCGKVDTDSDGDGAADCVDGCPDDVTKTTTGACGCGVADTDSDGDGTADCKDGCPSDPKKTSPGKCGCGKTDGKGGNCSPCCKPHFWSCRPTRWCSRFRPSQDFDDVFGVNCFKHKVTLGDACKREGGGLNALCRHAAAALQNCNDPDVDYPLTESQVISKVKYAIQKGGSEIQKCADLLEDYNELDDD